MKRVFKVKGLSIFIVLAVWFCFSTMASSAELADEFVIGRTSGLRTLEVHWMGSQETAVNWHTYEPLVWLGSDGTIKPMLAESWQVSSDGLQWVFKLRKGVRFSDGTDFNAEDAAANIQRQIDSLAEKKPTHHAFLYKNVKKVEVVDKHTMQVICKEPIGPFLNYLSILLMLPKEAIDKWGSKRIAEIVPGTGPYIKKSQIPNKGAELVANPNYWQKGLPVMPRVVYREFVEEATLVNALRRGEVDAIYPINHAFIPLLVADKNITVESLLPFEIIFMGLKVDIPPFNNLKARQALNYAMDRKLIIDSLMGGAGRPMGAYIQEGMPGYASHLKPPARDVEKARLLLKESGYNGRKLKFIGPPPWFPATRETCEALAAMMQEVGFNVELTMLEGGAFTKARKTGDYDLHFLGSRAITGEPQRYLEERVLNDIYKSGWKNNECFDLIRKAGKTIDRAEKEKLYIRIQEIMYNELAPQIYLWQLDNFYAYRNNVKNFKVLRTLTWYAPRVAKYKE
ncbi:MAG: ABC transporter substrate-binding protein [Deltaproteobacteria bacterium]|nr:ABC transporter substrate-binding protein [Deltaproteobacteria bacterium]